MDLLTLVELSLGSQENSGIVNFNYLHELLLQIVQRLGDDKPPHASPAYRAESQVMAASTGDREAALPAGLSRAATEGDLQGPSEVSLPSGSVEQTPEHVKPRQQGVSSVTSHPRNTSGSRMSIVSAANDLGALERKLQLLESRVNTMESLSELLERRGSDKECTPVKDMWNFTHLTNKISSAEQGVEKTSQIIDELLGEVSGLTKMVHSLDEQLQEVKGSQEESLKGISTLEERLNQLEALKLASQSDSPGEAFTAMVGALNQKFGALQEESGTLKQRVEAIEGSMVTSAQLEELLGQQAARLEELHKRLEASERSGEMLGERVSSMASELEQLLDQTKQLDVALSLKVDASDLSSLIPKTDSSESASLMPKLLEIQNKISRLEADLGKQPSLPPDVLDRITAMQNAIDHLSDELSRLSSRGSGSDSSRVEELGSQLAQLRERVEDMDRAVAALTAALSTMQQGQPAEEADEGVKYADMESLLVLQNTLSAQEEGLERLLGTVANLSHEEEIDKEHIKTLYGAVDELKAVKADKEQVTLEVEEKADRRALEGKASREWVDSTFERLDKEIREAKAHLMGQEEAFKTAVSQLNEDVEGKLDRMELEPLKDYFDKRLARVKTSPVCAQEKLGDDAAGFRKPLRFRCISCDKPLGLKSNEVVPSLPQIAILPSNKSLRPYTTYELELIRRQQKIGMASYVPKVMVDRFPPSIRAAGGSHTVTRPYQKVRVTPLSSPHNPESSQPMARSAISGPSPPRPNLYPRIADELDIVGQDGHVYKGRAPPASRPLPSLVKAQQTATYGRVTSSRGRRTRSPPPHPPFSPHPPLQ